MKDRSFINRWIDDPSTAEELAGVLSGIWDRRLEKYALWNNWTDDWHGTKTYSEHVDRAWDEIHILASQALEER